MEARGRGRTGHRIGPGGRQGGTPNESWTPRLIHRVEQEGHVIAPRPQWLVDELIVAAETKRRRKNARRLRERDAGGWGHCVELRHLFDPISKKRKPHNRKKR